MRGVFPFLFFCVCSCLSSSDYTFSLSPRFFLVKKVVTGVFKKYLFSLSLMSLSFLSFFSQTKRKKGNNNHHQSTTALLNCEKKKKL